MGEMFIATMGLADWIMSRKIAVIAYSAPPFSTGGVASAHFNLFRALERAGIDARLFTFGDYQKPDEKNIVRRGTTQWVALLLRRLNGVIFSLIDQGKKAYQIADILSSLLGSWRMGREISRFAPEVVILSDHGAPGLMISKDPAAKWILVSHHNPGRFIGGPYFSDFSEKDARWAIDLENRVLKKVNAVICPSNYMQEWFLKSYIFEGKINVIPNLLDITVLRISANAKLSSSLNLEPDDPIVYLPSVGSRLKGADYAVEIIRHISAGYSGRVGFYISGLIEFEFENKVKNIPANAHIFLAGQQPYAQHIANVKACSFGISPSLMENYSMALLEAVCCGVPMLAFKTGGNAEIINDEYNGFLVSEGDVQSLCKRALWLLQDGNLAIQKQRTFEYSSQHLDPDIALRAYIDLIESV